MISYSSLEDGLDEFWRISLANSNTQNSIMENQRLVLLETYILKAFGIGPELSKKILIHCFFRMGECNENINDFIKLKFG